jgi:hypothetical protein
VSRVFAFTEKEESIYVKFKKAAQEVRRTGTTQDKAVVQKVGGIAVVARHLHLAGRLNKFTRRIKELIPCIAYDVTNEHSTFCVQDSPNFVFDAPKHTGTFSALVMTVREILTSTSKAQRKNYAVDYGKPLYNKSTVIIPGQPSNAYVDLLLTISDACEKVADTHASWGSHITAARFLCSQGPEEVEPFCDFMEREAPGLGENQLSEIDVCTFTTTTQKFHFRTYQRLHI